MLIRFFFILNDIFKKILLLSCIWFNVYKYGDCSKFNIFWCKNLEIYVKFFKKKEEEKKIIIYMLIYILIEIF